MIARLRNDGYESCWQRINEWEIDLKEVRQKKERYGGLTDKHPHTRALNEKIGVVSKHGAEILNLHDIWQDRLCLVKWEKRKWGRKCIPASSGITGKLYLPRTLPVLKTGGEVDSEERVKRGRQPYVWMLMKLSLQCLTEWLRTDFSKRYADTLCEEAHLKQT